MTYQIASDTEALALPTPTRQKKDSTADLEQIFTARKLYVLKKGEEPVLGRFCKLCR